MAELGEKLVSHIENSNEDFKDVVADINKLAESADYSVVELNDDKPWGAYLRIDSAQADQFVEEFFPGLSPEDARMGIEGAELSPKFLVVKPGERLSWQYHHRRAERWCFLTEGAYRKSETDDESERFTAKAGEVVQFKKGERHRLEGVDGDIVLVAEIWQHADAADPSNEDDIVRVSDDYAR